MTTKPTIVCPNCRRPIDLEEADEGAPARCAACGTEVVRAEQPGDPASAH